LEDFLNSVKDESFNSADESNFEFSSKENRPEIEISTRNIRPTTRGKFIFVGKEKFYIKGVTYGPFRPDTGGSEYHSPELVSRDFDLMSENEINTVRTYTVPPLWLLDLAEEKNLRVMVGLPWEQHITFLDDKKRVKMIRNGLKQDIRSCQEHPAVLSYAIGNEIPASIVRWYGPQRVENLLWELYEDSKSVDPDGLVTYVNYPTTEYLQLPFIDFVCFNVFLEEENRLKSYLARLQNLVDERPLVMTEIGLDSRRNGEIEQANSLGWQIGSVFEAGAAGVIVFSWTDEWHRGGEDIDDWDFGLTRRDRKIKPALSTVKRTFAQTPFSDESDWPRISVVVCTYNGSSTILDCLEGIGELDYPDYEVIVVNDGSSKVVADIVRNYDYQLINIEHQGLSAARNVGMRAASGEIVAYIDDDARPDKDWLRYLATTFKTSDHIAVGGPNLSPPGDGQIAECVGNSPGNPTHVLISDEEAEHIPGCNMAFRKSALEDVGGFDSRYWIAGDDVEICWRLRQRGWTLGYNPSAIVWHHRRNSIRTYLKQQMNYGKAEALLEMKWPEKYRRRVSHGMWGTNLFQSIYESSPPTFLSIARMPEWYLLIVLLMLLFSIGLLWRPLLFVYPLLSLTLATTIYQAFLSSRDATFSTGNRLSINLFKLRVTTLFLHLVQPLARLWGRLNGGLNPFRRFKAPSFVETSPRQFEVWSESWRAPEKWFENLESYLKCQNTVIKRGGEFDRWDFEIRGGLFGAVRTLIVVEEHGSGRQMLKFRIWPKFLRSIITLFFIFLSFTLWSIVDQAWLASVVLGGLSALFGIRMLLDYTDAKAILQIAIHGLTPVRFRRGDSKEDQLVVKSAN
jgi:GT2 family glycosyltransferase